MVNLLPIKQTKPYIAYMYYNVFDSRILMG